MFRLIVLLCLLPLSVVGNIIYGRILLDGDDAQAIRLPSGSKLVVQLEDASVADAAATVLQRVEVSNLRSFPSDYAMKIPTGISSVMPYSLTARITKGDTLLYISNQHTQVDLSVGRSVNTDISVVAVEQASEKRDAFDDVSDDSWPELVGRTGTYAVEYIKKATGLDNVFTLPEGSMMTMDYRTDRVRIIVNKDGIVTQTPSIG